MDLLSVRFLWISFMVISIFTNLKFNLRLHICMWDLFSYIKCLQDTTPKVKFSRHLVLDSIFCKFILFHVAPTNR